MVPDNSVAPLREIVEGGVERVSAPMVRRQVAELKVRSASRNQMNLDGEPMEARGIAFRALPGALRFHLPENCPLLG